jgi:hypothetical protein
MKSIFFILTLIGLFCAPSIGFAQKQNPNTSSKSYKPQWTIEQVKEMARKYGIEDSISPTKRHFLVYFDKSSIEKYLQKESKAVQAKKEYKAYLSATSKVRTFEDDIKLLEQYPSVKADVVKMHGGDIGYKQYVTKSSKYKWRIHRNSQGGLYFERADLPTTNEEKQFGQRIDNLPRQ